MQLWSKTEREEALEYKYKCHLNREDGLKSSTLQMTESICLITTKCFHKTAQSPLSWETTKAVPSPWKPVLLAHYRSATIDAKAGRIWALCVLGDTRGYVTVKGIGIPLTLSEKLASPRKEENEIERFLNSTKTRPLFTSFSRIFWFWSNYDGKDKESQASIKTKWKRQGNIKPLTISPF